MSDASNNLAVLIDADNVSFKVVAGLMAEVANYGNASVRRIYGDWTSPLMKGWRDSLLTWSIIPIQQFSYTTGKNATDGAMIIDAMDLLYTGRLSAFYLVSSDSDFTRLAARIREQGLTVYGFGKRNTNHAFVAACNKFVYFDVLPVPGEGSEPQEQLDEPVTSPQTPRSFQLPQRLPPRLPMQPATPLSPVPSAFVRAELAKRPLDQAARDAIRRTILDSDTDLDGWVHLAHIGIVLGRVSPDMQARNYGYLKLRDFVEASGLVDIKWVPMGDHPPIVMVRLNGYEEPKVYVA